MNTSTLSAACVTLLLFAWPARGDLVPVSGVQSSSGLVRVVSVPDDPIEGSYSISAPDPLASWSPADEHLSRIIDTSGGFAEASIDSTFSSTIESDRVQLSMGTNSAALTSTPFGLGAEIEYTQTFHFSFRLDAPATATLFSQISRNNGGWPTRTPFSLSFGRDGDAPIIAFAYGGSGENYFDFIPPTVLELAAGTYSVSADNYNFWGAGRGGTFSDRIAFDLQIVPSPSTAALLGAAAMCGGRGRRRK